MIEQTSIFDARRAPLPERYRAWKATPDGTRFLHDVELAVLDVAVNNPRRIEINLIWAAVRDRLHIKADNSYRAFASRDLVAKWAHLQPMIRMRVQKAA